MNINELIKPIFNYQWNKKTSMVCTKEAQNDLQRSNISEAQILKKKVSEQSKKIGRVSSHNTNYKEQKSLDGRSTHSKIEL